MNVLELYSGIGGMHLSLNGTLLEIFNIYNPFTFLTSILHFREWRRRENCGFYRNQ